MNESDVTGMSDAAVAAHFGFDAINGGFVVRRAAQLAGVSVHEWLERVAASAAPEAQVVNALRAFADDIEANPRACRARVAELVSWLTNGADELGPDEVQHLQALGLDATNPPQM